MEVSRTIDLCPATGGQLGPSSVHHHGSSTMTLARISLCRCSLAHAVRHRCRRGVINIAYATSIHGGIRCRQCGVSGPQSGRVRCKKRKSLTVRLQGTACDSVTVERDSEQLHQASGYFARQVVSCQTWYHCAAVGMRTVTEMST